MKLTIHHYIALLYSLIKSRGLDKRKNNCTITFHMVRLTWILQKVDQKYLGSFEMWGWRRMEISWTDLVKNEELHKCQGGEEYSAYSKRKED